MTVFFSGSGLLAPVGQVNYAETMTTSGEDKGAAPQKSFVLLGHPVRHSISAPMMTAAFRVAGFRHTYNALDIARIEQLRRGVQMIRDGFYEGANITLPYKTEAVGLVDRLDDSVTAVGALNVIAVEAGRKLAGYNTDVTALQAEIAALTPARGRAVVIGAGGAALAAVAACKRLGFALVGVTTRSWSHTEAIHESKSAERVRALGGMAAVWPTGDQAVAVTKLSMEMRLQWSELARSADLVIQATSAGMLGGAPGEPIAALVPFSAMRKDAAVLDVIYRPERTPFLVAAEAAGLRTASGLGMLVRQAEATYRIWLGQEPPEGVMRRAGLAVLGGDAAPPQPT